MQVSALGIDDLPETAALGRFAPFTDEVPVSRLFGEDIGHPGFFDCVYNMTGEDVLEGRIFKDSIAMAANPVIHYYGYRRFLTHEGYDIPYRCLVPSVVEGLLVVGRCMGSDQIAYESWRAMAHIFAIGEAAGTAAALAALEGKTPRAVDVERLRARLIEKGAEIGQSRAAG